MFDFNWFADPNAWAALATLTLLEIVLGIDNIVFLSILVDRLPPEKRRPGRIFGLGLAMLTRLTLLAAGPISEFVSKHPTIKMLALSFLILIGTALIAEGLHFEVPKGYTYFAMAFSLGVELLNLRVRTPTSHPPAADI